MDLSKLPKLSSSPEPPKTDLPPVGQPTVPSQSPQTPPQQRQYQPAPPLAAEAWISFGIGAILLYMTPNTIKYVYGKLTGTMPGIYLDPTPGVPPGSQCDYINWLDSAGNIVKHQMYRDTLTFWSDLAITSFALVLILDGLILMFARRAAIVFIAFWLTLVTALGNLLYLVKTMDQGFPLISALAIVIGGYIAMSQWATYKSLRR